jgi:sulfate adenylyltransferase
MLSQIKVSLDDYYELKNIKEKVYYPLNKLVDRKNFKSILNNYKLTSGKIFPLPIFLSVEKNIAIKLKLNQTYKLTYRNKNIGKLKVEDVYKINKIKACKKIFKTSSLNHPGVKKFLHTKEYFIGGTIKQLINKITKEKYKYLEPSSLKKIIKKNKWKSLVGFQTRNIPHRAHEQLLRTSLEYSDGLFIQPLLGNKKTNDFTNEAIFKTYKFLIKNYFPKNKIILGPLYASMWYAGPREAVFHAIIRKNYGCSNFIVGRDHAGVGNFYKKYEAQNIFNFFQKNLNINIFKFAGPFFCKKCDGIVTENSCQHYKKNNNSIVEISGTEVRRKLLRNMKISNKVIRPEIVRILRNINSIFIN